VREREGYNDSGALPVRFVLSKLSFCFCLGCEVGLRADGGVDHLCKHRLTVSSPTKPGKEWLEAVEKLGPDQNVFMKLSGAFNEFDGTTPSSGSELVKSSSPIVSKVFDAFGDRVMFGSDWPVCNVGGSMGEKGNWGLWVECVEGLLKERKITEADSESVWWKAGSTAYDVQL
jgi:L-rhamnono-1,4-lactonase